MQWNYHWPFKTRKLALQYERVYLRGYYSQAKGRPIVVVSQADLELERWLEDNAAKHVAQTSVSRSLIENIWLWKMRPTLERDGKCADPPPKILSDDFQRALLACRDANSTAKEVRTIVYLTSGVFPMVRVRVASAFLYWLKPKTYQIIDRRVTAALNLDFSDSDYTVENYLRYCALCRDLSLKYHLSLRCLDRALFTYEKLLTQKAPIVLSV